MWKNFQSYFHDDLLNHICKLKMDFLMEQSQQLNMNIFFFLKIQISQLLTVELYNNFLSLPEKYKMKNSILVLPNIEKEIFFEHILFMIKYPGFCNDFLCSVYIEANYI